jgi:phospholipase C
MIDPMSRIEHVVVVMMENRSLDNLLGYLYADRGNHPLINIPKQLLPTYDGLLQPYPGGEGPWNPENPGFFDTPPELPVKVYVRPVPDGKSAYHVPTPHPQESFDHMNRQIYGNHPPGPGAQPRMLGFLVDYATTGAGHSGTAEQIMQCFTRAQLPTRFSLAREYAVCDRWFASAPSQTWPNRAFVHTGTSNGHVNNGNYDPLQWDVRTIFNVLDRLGHSFAVYSDMEAHTVPYFSLTYFQLPQLLRLWNPARFHSFSTFKEHARSGLLPRYSFIEPTMVDFQLLCPNDEHPPHDVRLGEKFLWEVYRAVRTGKKWESTLLVITSDEHGGCYDHVPPPETAVPPDPQSQPGAEGFRFNRFGVRVPTVLISPWIEAGTVFRAPADSAPFDHTSILATLRDWLGIPREEMLPSARIAAAPTFGNVLTRTDPRRDDPVEPPIADRGIVPVSADTPLTAPEKSFLASIARARNPHLSHAAAVEPLFASITKKRHAIDYLNGLRSR